MIKTKFIETSVHGRYLLRSGPEERLLVGFHGYAENAEMHTAELEKLPGAGEWTLVAVQALHPFYVRSTQEVVASWMTHLDREHAIADNVAYVRRVIEQFPAARTVVFAGFSQGAAMAYRATAAIPAAGLIVLGGAVPRDVTDAAALPPILVGRGVRDEWYTAEQFEKDLRFFAKAADVQSVVFDGGHEWSDPFRAAAGEFLKRLVS